MSQGHRPLAPSPSGRELGRGENKSNHLVLYPLILPFSRREKGHYAYALVTNYQENTTLVLRPGENPARNMRCRACLLHGNQGATGVSDNGRNHHGEPLQNRLQVRLDQPLLKLHTYPARTSHLPIPRHFPAYRTGQKHLGYGLRPDAGCRPSY